MRKFSEFSRNEFYNGEALKDANTIQERNEKFPFDSEKVEADQFGSDVANNKFGRE